MVKYPRGMVLALFVPTMLVVAFISLLLHETGHGLTAKWLGGKFEAMYVFPGREIWPDFGQRYTGHWDGYFGLAETCPAPDWEPYGWQDGLVYLMGSGTSLILSALALSSLLIFKPKGILARMFLFSESLMYLDIVSYTIFPSMGLKHFLFFGGKFAEPLIGAIWMGIPKSMFMLFIVIIFIIFTVALASLLRKWYQSP